MKNVYMRLFQDLQIYNYHQQLHSNLSEQQSETTRRAAEDYLQGLDPTHEPRDNPGAVVPVIPGIK